MPLSNCWWLSCILGNVDTRLGKGRTPLSPQYFSASAACNKENSAKWVLAPWIYWLPVLRLTVSTRVPSLYCWVFLMILFLMQQRVHRLLCNCHLSLPFCYEVSLLDPFINFFTMILLKVPLFKSREHSSAAPENPPLKPITLKSRAEHVVLINYSVSILRTNFALVTHQRPAPHPCRTANIPLLIS